jgi:hypothetical protein
MGKKNTLFSKPVNVGSDRRMSTVGLERLYSKIIRENENDIGSILLPTTHLRYHHQQTAKMNYQVFRIGLIQNDLNFLSLPARKDVLYFLWFARLIFCENSYMPAVWKIS